MTDLISRNDAFGAVQGHFDDDGFKGYHDGQKMMDRIKALPSADAVHIETYRELYEKYVELKHASTDRLHGEWYQIKDHKIMGEGYLWHCSICDYKVYQDSSKDYPTENFCPNCGAIMVKGGDTE